MAWAGGGSARSPSEFHLVSVVLINASMCWPLLSMNMNYEPVPEELYVEKQSYVLLTVPSATFDRS